MTENFSSQRNMNLVTFRINEQTSISLNVVELNSNEQSDFIRKVKTRTQTKNIVAIFRFNHKIK